VASCEVIKFKGLEIVYTDVSNSTVEESLEMIKLNHAIIRQKPSNSVLSLINVQDAQFNTKLVNRIRENVRRNDPYVLSTAVFGLNSFRRIVLDTIVALTGRKITVLENFEEGRLWLHDQYQQEKSLVS